MSTSPRDDLRERLLRRIGATLIRCQVAEGQLKHCLRYVFPGLRGEKRTLSLLRSLEDKYRRRELGKLLKELRSTMQVAAGFDDTLKRFLVNRNVLVHGMLDLFGEEGSEATEIFLDQLYKDAVFVGATFYAFMMRWAKDDGMYVDPQTEERHAGIVPYLDALVWPKERND